MSIEEDAAAELAAQLEKYAQDDDAWRLAAGVIGKGKQGCQKVGYTFPTINTDPITDGRLERRLYYPIYELEKYFPAISNMAQCAAWFDAASNDQHRIEFFDDRGSLGTCVLVTTFYYIPVAMRGRPVEEWPLPEGEKKLLRYFLEKWGPKKPSA